MRNRDFFDNKWVVRLVSLLFAIFLYIFVGIETNQFTQANDPNNTSVNVTETISNVPVYVGETDEDVFVSGLPESATIQITAPRNIINQVASDEVYAVTEDLTGIEPGTHTVRLEMEGISSESDIEYQITPSRVVVEVDRLASIDMPVTYELGENLLQSGYEVTNVTLDPSQVTLTGKQASIDSIASVAINITSEIPVDSSFTQSYSVQVRDVDGNLLDVNVSAPEVEAEVEVAPIGQSVDLTILPQGEDTTNYSYQYEFAEISSVVVYDESESLSPLEAIPAIVDVSGLTSSDTLMAPLQLPQGIDEVSVTEVPVTVTVTPLDNETSEPVSESGESFEEPTEGDANSVRETTQSEESEVETENESEQESLDSAE